MVWYFTRTLTGSSYKFYAFCTDPKCNQRDDKSTKCRTMPNADNLHQTTLKIEYVKTNGKHIGFRTQNQYKNGIEMCKLCKKQKKIKKFILFMTEMLFLVYTSIGTCISHAF